MSKKDKLKEIEELINNNQNTLIEITKSIEKIDANIRLLKERRKYTEDNDDQTKKILNIKEYILKLESNMNEIKNEINLKNEELNNKKNIYEEKNNTYQSILNNKNSLANKLDNKNREETDIRYKIDYLTNSINNSDSIPRSVKNIINNSRLSGVHNIIGKLISYDDKYYKAINIALGGASNYLVVDTSNNAKEMVKYLKDNKLGRATFFPIDTIKPRYIDNDTLNRIKDFNGFIDIASKLIERKEAYRNIIENQLGHVIICDNIDNANTLSKMINHKYKIVTLDGQVINVGGSITGGSSIENNNILKDKYELENKKLELEKVINEKKELNIKLNEANNELSIYDKDILGLKSEINELNEFILIKNRNLDEVKVKYENNTREIKDLEVINNNSSDNELENMLNMYYSAISNRDNINKDIESLKNKKTDLEKNIEEIESIIKRDSSNINSKEKTLNELELKLNTMNIKLDNLLIDLGEEYNMTYEAASSKYKLEVDEDLARVKVRELKQKIKNLGYVNVDAIEEYQNVRERYDFLSSQRDDLKQAEDTLLEIIKEMDEIMKEKFLTTFEAIRQEFKKVFISMFHGGEAELILTDPDNLLETGIEIQAVPTGKNLKSISLLSGGEKTFTAISLLFAILNVRPVPFCLLDEVEAALDDANVESFGNYLYKYKNKTQFILITHKKKTMEFADILYGITMQESGVSKLVSVKLEDIEK